MAPPGSSASCGRGLIHSLVGGLWAGRVRRWRAGLPRLRSSGRFGMEGYGPGSRETGACVVAGPGALIRGAGTADKCNRTMPGLLAAASYQSVRSYMNPIQTLQRRIESGQAVVGIIGLGYVGLPLAHTLHAGGLRVLGFDTDTKKIEALERG